MRRTRTLATGLLVVGIGVTALAGCSSGSKDKADPKPSGSAATPSGSTAAPAPTTTAPAGRGHLDYAGDRSGGFDAKNTSCVIAAGHLLAVTTASTKDVKDGAAPGFTATLAGTKSLATLVTADKHTYLQKDTSGIAGRKAGDAWVVFVSGAKLDSADGGGSITVNGTLSCTTMSGG